MQAVVFDLDGTLAHSAPDLHAAANVVLRDLDAPPLDLETVIGFIGNGIEVLVRRVLVCSGFTATPERLAHAVAVFERYYSANLTTLTRPYPGAEALLRTLQDAGVAMALCTNKPEAPARALCQEMGLDPYFTQVVGGDTLDRRKPDPAPLLHAIHALQSTPQQTLYVGDSHVDYETAKSAGVPFCFYRGGYLRQTIADFAPEYTVSDLQDIAGIVGL